MSRFRVAVAVVAAFIFTCVACEDSLESASDAAVPEDSLEPASVVSQCSSMLQTVNVQNATLNKTTAQEDRLGAKGMGRLTTTRRQSAFSLLYVMTMPSLDLQTMTALHITDSTDAEPKPAGWEAYSQFFRLTAIILVATFVVLPAYAAWHEKIERLTCFSYRHAVMLTFMTLLVSSDISQRGAAVKTNHYSFSPAALVIITEALKFVISLGLFGAVVVRSDDREKIDRPSRYDVFLLQLPAFVFFIHNLVLLKSVEQCSLATYLVLRETRVVFTALLWMAVFQVRLGCVRMTAIVGILVGFAINKAHRGVLGNDTWLGILFGITSGFTSAMGTVLCEFAFKNKASIDINLQNMILYMSGIGYGIIYMAIVSPGGLKSAAAFFEGFGPPCLSIILLSVVQGLTNSRILKYLNSVTKTIAAASCIPITVCLGALWLQTKLHWYEVAASLVVLVCVSAYVSQGPLQRQEPKSAGS